MFCPQFFRSKQVYFFHSSSFYNIYSVKYDYVKKNYFFWFDFSLFIFLSSKCFICFIFIKKGMGQKWTRRKLWNIVHVTLTVKLYLLTIPIWQNPGSDAIIGPGPLNNVSRASIRFWNFSSVCECLVYKSYSSH